jgi:hypothetical protein
VPKCGTSRTTWLFLISLPALLIAHKLAEAATPSERTFRDWVVACDNARTCTAVGMMPEDGSDVALVHVRRAAGDNAAPEILLVMYADEAMTQTMRVAVDGKPIEGVETPRRGQPVPDFGYLQTALMSTEIPPFVGALRRGSRLQITIDSGQTSEISLDGAMAALLFIDDQQGRVDTVTALARVGSRPATSVPPAPPLPVVRARPAPADASVDPGHAAAIARGWAREAAERCALDEPDHAAEPETLAPLSDGHILVAVGCGHGAYNFESAFGIAHAGEPPRVEAAALALPTVDGVGTGGMSDSLTNGHFDPATARLVFFYKGRGLGDCGSSGAYVWTGGSFELAEWRSMPECRGVPEPLWPALWQSRER